MTKNNISDAIAYAQQKDVVNFSKTIEDELGGRIANALENKRVIVAQKMFDASHKE